MRLSTSNTLTLLSFLIVLSEMAFQSSEPVGALTAELFQFLSAPKQLERFLEQAEGQRALKPTELTAYLARLDKTAQASLLPWMGRMTTPAHRRPLPEAPGRS